MATYTTLTVVLVNKEELKFTNLDDAAVKLVKENIWTRGVKKRINDSTEELISPFIISRAYLQKQTEKL